MALIGAPCLVSIAYWRSGTLVRQYSHRLKVRCASPIFKPIAYKLRFTNRKRKYLEEKSTATLKSKQTSIATVRNHLRTLASFLTPLIFHWSLPLKNQIFGRLSIICHHLSCCQQFRRNICKIMRNTNYENTEQQGSFLRPCDFIIVFDSFFTLTITVPIY